jgi:hypothetical protein
MLQLFLQNFHDSISVYPIRANLVLVRLCVFTSVGLGVVPTVTYVCEGRVDRCVRRDSLIAVWGEVLMK